ncbi:MAG: DUF2887 domain-containing protein, partial [Gammaproteobacteria bacterium]
MGAAPARPGRASAASAADLLPPPWWGRVGARGAQGLRWRLLRYKPHRRQRGCLARLAAGTGDALFVPAAVRGERRPPSSAGVMTPLEILDLVETILVYKFPRLSRGEIRDMLQLPVADLQQTRFYQAVYGEGRQEGRQEGQLEGHQRQVRLILRQLQRRLGPV